MILTQLAGAMSTSVKDKNEKDKEKIAEWLAGQGPSPGSTSS